MRKLDFWFQTFWDMGDACGDDVNDSNNPAPATSPGIYLIHNAHTNSTYVGYAGNAKNRWGTRYEVFHCLGVPREYGKQVICAFCTPVLDGNILPAKNELLLCEKILIRGVVKGVLGVTTNTNTTNAKTPLILSDDLTYGVWFGNNKAPWGKLENPKGDTIVKGTPY